MRLVHCLAGLIVATALVGCAGGDEDAATPRERWTMRALFASRSAPITTLRINDRAQIIAGPSVWWKGKASELGTLGRKGEQPHAAAINNRGQVAGYLFDVRSFSETHSMILRTPVVWQGERTRALSLLSGDPKAWPPPWVEGDWGGEATAINDRGQIVGWSDTRPVGDGIEHAFLWQRGKMRDLGTLGGEESRAMAINDRGQVIGSWGERGALTYAFLWENGKMHDLGTLGGRSEAVAINERGQVVGWSETKAKNKDGYPIAHAFLWQRGKMRDLGTLGGEESRAVAINDRGQVVGSSETGAKDRDGDPITHAFLWENGKMHDLGTLGGPSSEAVAINELGQIVGSSDTSAKTVVGGFPITHAVVWERGSRPIDLGALGAPSAEPASEAHQINERSQIVGSGMTERGEMVILWTLRR